VLGDITTIIESGLLEAIDYFDRALSSDHIANVAKKHTGLRLGGMLQ
jgi:hypothetical protein